MDYKRLIKINFILAFSHKLLLDHFFTSDSAPLTLDSSSEPSSNLTVVFLVEMSISVGESLGRPTEFLFPLVEDGRPPSSINNWSNPVFVEDKSSFPEARYRLLSDNAADT